MHSKAVRRTQVHPNPSAFAPWCPSLEKPFCSALPRQIYFNSTVIKETLPDLNPRKLPLSEPGPEAGGMSHRDRFWPPRITSGEPEFSR